MSKKKTLAMVVWAAVASIGFVMSASAEETMSTDVAPVVVEGQQDVLPGGFVSTNDKVGVLGNMDAVDVPFSQQNYTEKTIERFADPAQGMNGILANDPSVRIFSPSPMYTDFNMRGLKMNAANYYINNIPNMFGQSRSMPAYVLESVQIVNGPNQVLNGSQFYNNGSDGYKGAPGLLLGTTKKATDKDINRYTQTFSGRGEKIENIDIGRRFGKDNEWGVRVNVRKDKGGLAVKGAYIDDKTIYVNVDHKTAKSTTNLFGGYYDFEIKGGQRWFNANGVDKGQMVKAPNGKNNMSFDDQFKANHGYLFTLNHEQKFSDKWAAFMNLGYQQYDEDKFDFDTGSLTLKNNGAIEGKFRNYLCESKGFYGQIGARNVAEVNNIKNNLSFAVDYYNYNNTFNRVSNATLRKGNVWEGIKIPSSDRVDAYLTGKNPIKDTAWSMTVADRVEIGKWNAFVSLQHRNGTYTNNDNKKTEASSNSWNPTYGIGYKPTENSSIYASHSESYTRAYLVGTSADILNPNASIDPIKLKQNEIGFKYKTGNMLHGLALFQLEQGSVINDYPVPGVSKYYVKDEGKDVYKGVEYTVAGKVSDKWNLMAGLMYLNAKRDKTQKGEKDGWYVNGAAKWNGVLALEYEADKNNSWIARLNYSDKSHINDKGAKVPSYTVVDLGYQHKTQFKGMDLTINAMCNNVLGKDYWIGARENYVALGNPRTFTLSAQFNF